MTRVAPVPLEEFRPKQRTQPWPPVGTAPGHWPVGFQVGAHLPDNGAEGFFEFYADKVPPLLCDANPDTRDHRPPQR